MGGFLDSKRESCPALLVDCKLLTVQSPVSVACDESSDALRVIVMPDQTDAITLCQLDTAPVSKSFTTFLLEDQAKHKREIRASLWSRLATLETESDHAPQDFENALRLSSSPTVTCEHSDGFQVKLKEPKPENKPKKPKAKAKGKAKTKGKAKAKGKKPAKPKVKTKKRKTKKKGTFKLMKKKRK